MIDATNLINALLSLTSGGDEDVYNANKRSWIAGEKAFVIRQHPDEGEGQARIALWDAIQLPPEQEGGSL